MDIPAGGKSSTISFRYNANNEELEELLQVCDDDPPTPQCESSQSSIQGENASPKKLDKTSSLIDKYFKSMRSEKPTEKIDDIKSTEKSDEPRSNTPKDVTSSPMKDYLYRLSKKANTSEVNLDAKEGNNETWKIFHDFRFKIAQAVEDIKTRSTEETKEKTVPRENSTSDSEENSVFKDLDQHSVGDTDNQVSSLESSIQNLSEVTPLTTKIMENATYSSDNKQSDSSDDTHKNIDNNEAEGTNYLIDDNNVDDVESGVEALEDTNINTLSDIVSVEPNPENENSENMTIPFSPIPKTFGIRPINSNIKKSEPHNFLNFPIVFFTFLLLFNYIFFSNSSIWSGFVMGVWFYCFINNVKTWVLDRYFSDKHYEESEAFQSRRNTILSNSYTIPSVKEHRPLKKYEGWINHYRFSNYDPSTYHINKTTTAFIKLEGCNLRISYTKAKISKRALWDEKIENVAFYQHRFYNLSGARVILLPNGLVNKRQWSKKYPICIVLNEKDVIQVLEKETISTEKRMSEDKKNKEQQVQHDVETTETNTSPEKKKKFVWRKREKSISHSEAEPGKEGLRHRLVRKIHREKKSDSVSEPPEESNEAQLEKTVSPEVVCQETDTDLPRMSIQSAREDLVEDLDDNDLYNIKDFLDETDLEAEGVLENEWSMHVKHSKDNSYVYLFARTSRDKHDWFRRLRNAVTEANANSAESSCADEKPALDSVIDSRESVDVSVAFAKTSNRSDSTSEGVTIMTASTPAPSDYELYEKNFWTYFYKIVQSKSPIPSVPNQSYILPAEVTWLNTLIARLFYDVMRDPQIIHRLQTRIQKKVHTIKLPSFMSPLVVTELSLAGACPLVERMATPSWDERGVWLDVDVRYDGGAYISILTQINLMKLKEKNILDEQLLSGNLNLIESELEGTTSEQSHSDSHLRRSKPAIFDSDVEDSAESSSDEDSASVQPVESDENAPPVPPETPPAAAEGSSSKKKFLRIVDRIATSKYFQQVTDYKYVKRAMEGLSNTDIKLQVEVQGVEGRLAVNLPPPPHDRLWIGFRTNPHLVLKARPAFGTRSVRITQITNWIEQKLIKEFEKVLVLPNMEDLVIDFMTPTPVVFQ